MSHLNLTIEFRSFSISSSKHYYQKNITCRSHLKGRDHITHSITNNWKLNIVHPCPFSSYQIVQFYSLFPLCHVLFLLSLPFHPLPASLIIVTFLPPYIISTQPPFFKSTFSITRNLITCVILPFQAMSRAWVRDVWLTIQTWICTSSRHFPKQKDISLDMNNAPVLDAKTSVVGSCFK